MFTNHVSPKLEVGFADRLTYTIESESLSPPQELKGFADKAVLTPMPTPISRSSKFVGFERGRRHLQPFVGPREF